MVRVLPTTTRPALGRRLLSVLLLPLPLLIASVVAASPAAAGGPLTSETRPVGSGVNRTLATSVWLDNRPTTGTGHPAEVQLTTANGTSCNSSQVASVWVQRIQAGTGSVLASGRLNNWDRCQTAFNYWRLDCCSGAANSIQVVSGCWTCDYNLWSGPGGSPSPTDKQALRVYLFNSSGTQLGFVTLPYPG